MPSGWGLKNRLWGRGEVLLFDAATGRVARTFRVPGVRELGGSVASIGDQDGDGVPEVITKATGLPDYSKDDDSGGLALVLSGSSGHVLFARRGWALQNLWLCQASAGDVDGDGREDLALYSGRAQEEDVEKVLVYRVDPVPGRSRVRIALQRTPVMVWAPDAAGSLEIGFEDSSTPLGMTFSPYSVGPLDGVFVESAPGSGNFLAIRPEQGTWDTSYWNPDPALRDRGLLDLAGRRVEVRGKSGDVYFRATIPSPTAEGFDARSALAPPVESPAQRSRGTVRVVTSADRGTTRVDLRTRRLSHALPLEVWIEEGIGTGMFTDLGNLERGRFQIDTGLGDPLPGFSPDGAALSGRLIEIRDGDIVVLRGTMP